MIPTKRQLTAWAALKNRRDRLETGLFLVEGRKVVDEVVAAGWSVVAVLSAGGKAAPGGLDGYELTVEQMERVSGFRSAPEVIAVVQLPTALTVAWRPGSLIFLLDGVQDPGNLGTILRTAGWFGFGVVCGSGGVDPWHPKVVQASMGAFLRVPFAVADPLGWLGALPPSVPVLGTFLDGEDLFSAPLPREGVIVLGSEGRGISPEVEALITRRLTIRRFGTAEESLNVAAAATLVGAEFRRRMV